MSDDIKIFTPGFLYTLISTAIFFKYFYREDISVFLMFTVPFFLFLPIIYYFINKELGLKKLNILAILAFSIGFIIAAFISNNNVWPIVLILWLVLSVPSLLIINMCCLIIKRMRATG